MFELFYNLFSLILIGLFLYIFVIAVYSMISGAPYAAMGQERLKTVIDMLNIKKGEKIVDLGSGDGRIVIACAQKGAIATGYEINLLLIWLSRSKIKKLGIKNAKILNKDFWSENYSQYDSLTVYALPHMLSRMGKKLRKELKPGSKVVSNHYKFPDWKITKTKDDVHLYIV